MTRRQIDYAKPEIVLGMLNSSRKSAANMLTAADSYQQSVHNPGGETWSGATATAAILRADIDREAIHNLREAIDKMADTATMWINDDVIPNLNDVRAKIASAEAAGFKVGDDLTVSYGRPPGLFEDESLPLIKLIEDAENRQGEIRLAALIWRTSDQHAADQINTDTQGLAFRLNAGRPNFGSYERMLRKAGLLSGNSPDGYYAQWLDNAARQGVAPEVLVEIARRHHITPEDFKILQRLGEIKDPDGKSYFHLPTNISGDDVRQAALMTYILNAGTDYDDAGKQPGVKNDFKETPYDADEVQRIIDRQKSNTTSYDNVNIIHDNHGRLVTTPNGILMGLGGNSELDGHSEEGGSTGGVGSDIFMVNIDDPEDEAAAQQLRVIVESGNHWAVDNNGIYEGTTDLDRLLHHEERHSQQHAERSDLEYAWDELTGFDWEKDAGLSDGNYDR